MPYRSTGPFTTDEEKYLAVNLTLDAGNWEVLGLCDDREKCRWTPSVGFGGTVIEDFASPARVIEACSFQL